MDWCSQNGARALQARIEDYWRERGHEVMIVLRDAGFHAAVRTTRFDLRSDLVNGLPQGVRRSDGVCMTEPTRRTSSDE